MSDAPHASIRTEHVLLRPVAFEDVDDCFEYADDEEWSRFTLMVPRPYERRHAVEFIAAMTVAKHADNCLLAIEHEGRMAGATHLMFRGSGVAEVGYSIARRLWGRGLAPEAVRAHLAHGFDDCELDVVYARIDPGNAASKRVVQKLGFTFEGTLRGREVNTRGRRVDHEHWSLLRSEWEGT